MIVTILLVVLSVLLLRTSLKLLSIVGAMKINMSISSSKIILSH